MSNRLNLIAENHLIEMVSYRGKKEVHECTDETESGLKDLTTKTPSPFSIKTQMTKSLAYQRC